MAQPAVVILAAGKGTRMLSGRQKILHEVGGRPMVSHSFEAAAQVADMPPLLVVGPGEDGVRHLFGPRAEPCTTSHGRQAGADRARDRGRVGAGCWRAAESHDHR